jgi:hypothetical protein
MKITGKKIYRRENKNLPLVVVAFLRVTTIFCIQSEHINLNFAGYLTTLSLTRTVQSVLAG